MSLSASNTHFIAGTARWNECVDVRICRGVDSQDVRRIDSEDGRHEGYLSKSLGSGSLNSYAVE